MSEEGPFLFYKLYNKYMPKANTSDSIHFLILPVKHNRYRVRYGRRILLVSLQRIVFGMTHRIVYPAKASRRLRLMHFVMLL